MYLGNIPTLAVKIDYVYTAIATQTSFSGADNNGLVMVFNQYNYDVFVNGVMLSKATDIAFADGTSLILTDARQAGDEIIIRNYGNIDLLNNYGVSVGNGSSNSVTTAIATNNKIYNGTGIVSQRANTFTVAANTTVYTADRWRITNGTNQALTVTPNNAIAFSGSGAYPSLKLKFNTAPTSGNVTLSQRINGADTLAGNNATLSFANYFNETISGSTFLKQNFGTGGSADVTLSTQTFTGTSTGGVPAVVKQLYVIPSTEAKTFGTGHYLEWNLVMPIRSTGNVILTNMSLVEGDQTAQPDPYAKRTYQQEISLCQYYFATIPPISISTYGIAGAALKTTILTQMRTTPTVTQPSYSYVNCSNGIITSVSDSSLTLQATITATDTVTISTTGGFLDSEL